MHFPQLGGLWSLPLPIKKRPVNNSTRKLEPNNPGLITE